MAIEVVCGGCQGRLLVETPGVIVACPHCGQHLSIPAPDAPLEAATDPSSAQSPDGAAFAGLPPQADQPAVDAVGGNEALPEFMRSADLTAPIVPDFDDVESTATPAAADRLDAASPDAPADADVTGADFPDFSGLPAAADDTELPSPALEEFAVQDNGSDAARATNETPVVPAAEAPDVATFPSISDAAAVDKSSANETTDPPVASGVTLASQSRSAGRKSRSWMFVFLFSYASAMTLMAAWLLMQVFGGTAKPHDLESLPDLKPPPESRKKHVSLIYVPDDAEMAPGHTLKLGEDQRFGSLKVTPLRVTKEALEFTHYSGNPAITSEPTRPVLKLWLQIENVSTEQVFAPLDRELTLARVVDKKSRHRLRANNFVCRASDKSRTDQKILVYDLAMSSEWDMKDCLWTSNDESKRQLKPGDVIETYIPTVEEGLDTLEGDLVWRVHFRKGYNPESLRGVTTIIEVVFNSDDVQS